MLIAPHTDGPIDYAPSESTASRSFSMSIKQLSGHNTLQSTTLPIPFHPDHPLEQLQNAQHDVVHVAEAGRLALLGVVQAACPVDGDVRLPVVQPRCPVNGPPAVRLAEVVQPVKHGAVCVLADVDWEE